MATVTHVSALDHVAMRLGEDLEMLEAIVSNDDNLTMEPSCMSKPEAMRQ